MHDSLLSLSREILRVYSKRTMRTTFSRKNEILLVAALNLGASPRPRVCLEQYFFNVAS